MAFQIFWTDTDGDHVLQLELPPQERAPNEETTRLPAVAFDGSVVDGTTIGTGQHELGFDILDEIAVDTLKEARRAGLNWVDLVLIPDHTDQSRSQTVRLMSAGEVRSENQRAQTYQSRGWLVRKLDGTPIQI